MGKRILHLAAAAGLAAFLGAGGCRKDAGYYSYKNTLHEFSGNTYDFLKSQTGVYDSFLLVLDRVGLSDSLKHGKFTVFAPTNASFQQAIEDLNNLRTIQNRAPLYLSTVPVDQLDSLTCRYLIPGLFPSDSMETQDGLDMYAVRYRYMMHGKYTQTTAEGQVNGGPGIIEYSDTKGSVYTRQWSISNTVAVDIKTDNGLVNVLDRNHEFGFDEFIGREGPTFSSPYTGVPFWIPGTIGLNQYDKGGEGVAYHDNDPLGNTGGKYRPSEGVDIETAGNGENGYDVGWTVADEWMNFTVNVADTGRYNVVIRTAGGDNGGLHFELDGLVITDVIKTHGDGNYQDYANYSAITTPLPKGKHVLKIYYDFANYNLRFVKFLPIDKPYPIPGVLPIEEYDQGGEGVGYHDLDASNAGNKYRSDEGVDIEQNKEEGGYDLGWTNAGEWLNFTVNVLASGNYNVDVLAASGDNSDTGHQFHIEDDGVDITGSMRCPYTGGYQAWTDVKTTVHLEKGVHVLRFYEETGGYNIRNITFTPIN